MISQSHVKWRWSNEKRIEFPKLNETFTKHHRITLHCSFVFGKRRDGQVQRDNCILSIWYCLHDKVAHKGIMSDTKRWSEVWKTWRLSTKRLCVFATTTLLFALLGWYMMSRSCILLKVHIELCIGLLLVPLKALEVWQVQFIVCLFLELLVYGI